MSRLVKMSQEKGFQVQLSSSPFEWYLAEKVVSNETKLEQLDDQRRLQLTLGVFPLQEPTLLHMIAEKSTK